MLNNQEKEVYFDFLKKATFEEIKKFLETKENKRDYLLQNIPKMPMLAFERDTVLDIIYERNDNDLLKKMINIYSSYGYHWYLNNNKSILKRAILDKNAELIKYFVENLEVNINNEDALEIFKKIDLKTLNYLIIKDAFHPDSLTHTGLIINTENNLYYKLTKESELTDNIIKNMKFIFENEKTSPEINSIILRIYKRGDPLSSEIFKLFNKVFEDSNFLFREGERGSSFVDLLIKENEFPLLEDMISNNYIPIDIRTRDKKILWDSFKNVDINEVRISYYLSDEMEEYIRRMRIIEEKYNINDKIEPSLNDMKNKKRI